MWAIYGVPPWQAHHYTSDLKKKAKQQALNEAEFEASKIHIVEALERAEQIHRVLIARDVELSEVKSQNEELHSENTKLRELLQQRDQ